MAAEDGFCKAARFEQGKTQQHRISHASPDRPDGVAVGGDTLDQHRIDGKKLDWYIYPNNLEQVIKELFNEAVQIKDSKLLVLTDSENNIECTGNKKIILTKTKKGVQLQLK